MGRQRASSVDDPEAAAAYCARLSGVGPYKQRPGYVNFAIDNPPD
ncbi:MAG: hypothetical protein OXH94_01100 [Rhodospirillales bacterium]|nr:hypothetical protein [Rhodospirillales bacterium]